MRTAKRKKGKRPKKGASVAKKTKQADRGPFGIGHRVTFPDEKSGSKSSEDDDEDPGSDFHAGPSTKSRQLQLQEYSEQRPGRLASRLLQKMQEILARQEGPMHLKTERNLTPATATSYFLTVLVPQYKEKMNLRTNRELRTLCKALDLVASGNADGGRPPRTEDQVIRTVPSRSGMEPSTTPRVDPGGGSEPGREGRDVDGHEGASDRPENATPDSRSSVAANRQREGRAVREGERKRKRKRKEGQGTPTV